MYTALYVNPKLSSNASFHQKVWDWHILVKVDMLHLFYEYRKYLPNCGEVWAVVKGEDTASAVAGTPSSETCSHLLLILKVSGLLPT